MRLTHSNPSARVIVQLAIDIPVKLHFDPAKGIAVNLLTGRSDNACCLHAKDSRSRRAAPGVKPVGSWDGPEAYVRAGIAARRSTCSDVWRDAQSALRDEEVARRRGVIEELKASTRSEAEGVGHGVYSMCGRAQRLKTYAGSALAVGLVGMSPWIPVVFAVDR